MKNLFVFILCIIVVSTGHAQLPAAAQILYDSAVAQDPQLPVFASNNGAQVIATPDSSSFYVQWFPVGSDPDSIPMIVTLPGSHCNAFMEFKSWFPQAQLHGCGIIAIQWYRYRPNPPYDYFPDDTLYGYIDSALTRINYPSNKALLHGFSRGSARTYSMIFADIQSGNNYFCTTMSNSGDADLNYPLYASIDSGSYGPNVFAGKHWNLFCGGQDTIVGCGPMQSTQTWLQSQGAVVDIFIQDPALSHDGFQLPTSYMYKDSILDQYLLCYNRTSAVDEHDAEINSISIFPNPASTEMILQSDRPMENATIIIYNSSGQVVMETANVNGTEVVIDCSALADGIYLLSVREGVELMGSQKITVSD